MYCHKELEAQIEFAAFGKRVGLLVSGIPYEEIEQHSLLTSFLGLLSARFMVKCKGQTRVTNKKLTQVHSASAFLKER